AERLAGALPASTGPRLHHPRKTILVFLAAGTTRKPSSNAPPRPWNPGPSGPGGCQLRRLYLHNISLIGSSMHTRRHFAALVDVARTAAVMPVVAARFPLGELADRKSTRLNSSHASISYAV